MHISGIKKLLGVLVAFIWQRRKHSSCRTLFSQPSHRTACNFRALHESHVQEGLAFLSALHIKPAEEGSFAGFSCL